MSKSGPGRPKFKKNVAKAIKALHEAGKCVETKNRCVYTASYEELQNPDGLLVKHNGSCYKATVIEIEDTTAMSRPNLCGKASLQGQELYVQKSDGEFVLCEIAKVVFVYPTTSAKHRAPGTIKANITTVTNHYQVKSLGLEGKVSAKHAEAELEELV